MDQYIIEIIALLGGLALFLFGMETMGKSLERLAGGKLQTVLSKMSSTVFRGFFLGMAVTAVIQSSSATTVMVVGFVNSGIMTLQQAIGVIMGSNVGTTVTSWILSLTALDGDALIVKLFKPTTLAPLLGAVGIVLFMFSKTEKKKSIGTILLGFMALMTGMSLMSDAMSFLEDKEWFRNLMISFSNPLIGILVGAALTAIIQSSSASIGILQGLCAIPNAVTVGMAFPIILGQNIGTCVTAIISTIGANRNARRTALIHLYFNVLGVVIVGALFYIVTWLSPVDIAGRFADPFIVAVLHTGFNLLATAILLPMSKLLEKMAYMTIPRQKVHQAPVLLDPLLLNTPAVAVQRSMDVAAQMAHTARESMALALELTKNFSEEGLEKVRRLENQTDQYEDALGSYLVQLTGKKLSVHDNRTLNTLLYTISDFERIADHAVAIAKAGQEMSEKKIRFSEQALEELAVLEKAMMAVIDSTVAAYEKQDLYQAMKVEPQEQVVDALVKEVKSRHIRRLRDGLCTVEYGFVLEDLLTSYERSADHCSNVAVEMLQVSEGKLEAHEYLNALKGGQLQESAQYSERFQKYRSRYTFPEEKNG